MNYLGVDYGKKKIGLSLSGGVIASPYQVIHVNGLKDALQKIQSIIIKEQIDQVVIGMPESGEAAIMVGRFVKELQKSMGKKVKIVTTHETLSSQNAAHLMIGLGVKKKKRQEEDAYASSLILQDYLETHRG